jgi:pimeloyl-ACP methyl ester carboxylesterase
LGEAPILVGHSDGASISLIYAGCGNPLVGLVLIAPHVFVEKETTAAIDALRLSFPGSEMPDKMAKYHQQPETTFWGWNDIWLDPAFADWNITDCLEKIECPVLIIQGQADQFGTPLHVEAIESGVKGAVETVFVAEAEHSPHLSHSDLVLEATVKFLDQLM